MFFLFCSLHYIYTSHIQSILSSRGLSSNGFTYPREHKLLLTAALAAAGVAIHGHLAAVPGGHSESVVVILKPLFAILKLSTAILKRPWPFWSCLIHIAYIPDQVIYPSPDLIDT